MWRVVAWITFSAGMACRIAAQTSPPPAPSPVLPQAKLEILPGAIQQGVVVDGIAVRIEGDIILESEVAELAAVQKLLDGKSRGRSELVNGLIDQWVLGREGETGSFPKPSDAEVQAAFDRLAANFPSAASWEAKLESLGLDDSIVKRQLRTQIYLSNFIEYRFRPGVEITDKAISDYYQTELAAELMKEKEPLPPLAGVANNIRELLTEKEVSRRADEWIADARSRLQIDVVADDGIGGDRHVGAGGPK
jgi:hypothetical protein